MFPIYTKTLS